MNSQKRKLSETEFAQIVKPLIEMPISWTWRGYGTTIFLEFGILKEEEKQRKDGSWRISRRGEITLMLQYGWRVERLRSIAFGSDSSKTKIETGLARLRGNQIINVSVEGRLPEIVLQLSNGYWVRSFVAWAGQPAWSLLFRESANVDYWTDVTNGKITLCREE